MFLLFQSYTCARLYRDWLLDLIAISKSWVINILATFPVFVIINIA